MAIFEKMPGSAVLSVEILSVPREKLAHYGRETQLAVFKEEMRTKLRESFPGAVCHLIARMKWVAEHIGRDSDIVRHGVGKLETRLRENDDLGSRTMNGGKIGEGKEKTLIL